MTPFGVLQSSARLNLDLTSLPQQRSYRVEIVNGLGHISWETFVSVHGAEVNVGGPSLRSRVHFLRVYSKEKELLREFALRAAEK